MHQPKSVDDLNVEPISDSLVGKTFDVVVSGSIASVESVRFIRSLRRLGATVQPWLTQGGAQFITPLALEWASANKCLTNFSGTHSHICTSDGVIVSPASSNMINRLAKGYTDTPASALIASALGQQKPVFILPAMHDSLSAAPSYQENIVKIETWKNVHILSARLEEGKRKFPEPHILADQISHLALTQSRPKTDILVTLGTNRGYIDDVRYLSNYSSGKLGSLIAEELFRNGFRTHVIAGPSQFRPSNATKLTETISFQDMMNAVTGVNESSLLGAVFTASVLDYQPDKKLVGKTKSGQSSLHIELVPTEKIISKVTLPGKIKIGFKLETELNLNRASDIAKDYCSKYNLSALICNELSQVDSTRHFAWAIAADGQQTELPSKAMIAKWITKQFL
ncbi:MAG: hypothetical protein NT027_12195 [Proteobacteria bacterium]|nr:hypothetical protein [Pseudomonadota bacterium]